MIFYKNEHTKSSSKRQVKEMNAEKSQKQHRRMTEAPIPRLILSLSLPTTVSMAVIALYTLADSYFVSSLGTAAGAAVGVVFAVHVLIQAVGYTLGMGGGSLISRCLGKKETKKAGEYAAAALFFGLTIGGIITALCLIFRHPLIDFLGATESIYQYALDYSIPLFWSALPMCGSFVLSQLLRAEGKALWSMAGIAVGGLANIGLDPLLIHAFHMGISGASTATLISQILSFLVLLSAYVFKKSQLNLFGSFGFSTASRIGTIFVTGLPSLLRQGLSGVAAVLLNHATAPHGDAALTAVSVVNRLFLLVFSICLGFGQGLMPVAGYNYGSGNLDRVKKAYRFSMLCATGIMFGVSLPLGIFAPSIIKFFRDDPEVIKIGAYALRLLCAVLFTHGIVTCTIMFLQALGRSTPATVLASARQGLFFLPLIFLLPARFGLHGLLLTQPLADLLTGIFAVFFAVNAVKRL